MRVATVGRFGLSAAGLATSARAPRRCAPPTRRRAAPAVRCAAPPPSLRTLPETYRAAPETAKVAFRAAVCVTALGAALLAAPLTSINVALGVSKAAVHAATFITAQSAALLAAPLSCLDIIFGKAATAALPSAAWVRIVGALACLLGVIYTGAALDDCAGRPPYAFYSATVWGRFFVSAAFYTIALTDLVMHSLALVALVNLIGAGGAGGARRRQGRCRS
jgi:hypothetical protein